MNAKPLSGQETRHRALPVLSILLALGAFVLGVSAALMAVNRLLDTQLAVYVPRDMDAASAVLDLMDDLVPYLFLCGAALLVLVLGTICVAVWRKAWSPVLRYGTVLLVVLLIAFGVWSWVSRAGMQPPVPPMTPTPVAKALRSLVTPLCGPTTAAVFT